MEEIAEQGLDSLPEWSRATLCPVSGKSRYNARMALSYRAFLQTLPEAMISQLPEPLQGIKVRQPWRWIVQFHYGEA